MNGDPARRPSTELAPARIKPLAVATVAVIVSVGALRGNPSVPAAAAAAVVAVAATAAAVYSRRLALLAAAVAIAAIAVEGHGLASDIGWFAACLLAGWCVIDGQPARRPDLLGRSGHPVRGRVAVGQARSRLGRVAGGQHPGPWCARC